MYRETDSQFDEWDLEEDEFDNFYDIFQDNFNLAIEEITKIDRNKEMLQLRYGLYDGIFYTLQEIGDKFNVSRERVRQICNSHINRIIKKAKYRYQCCKFFSDNITNWVCPGSDNDILNISLLVMRLPMYPKHLLIDLLCRVSFPSGKNLKETKNLISDNVTNLKELSTIATIQIEKQKQKFNRIIKHVIWTDNVTKISLSEFKKIKPKRLVKNGMGNSGSFYSNKNEVQIEYESGLEYQFCLYLEDLDNVLGYIHQPVKIEYIFNGEQFLYYPDFLVLLNDYRCFLVEIKPRSKIALYKNLIKYNVLQKFCILNGFGYLIFGESNSISDYMLHTVDSYKEKEFLSYLENNDISWLTLKQLRLNLDLSSKDVYSIILKNNIKWTLKPFNLSNSKTHKNEFVEQHLSFLKNNYYLM